MDILDINDITDITEISVECYETAVRASSDLKLTDSSISGDRFYNKYEILRTHIDQSCLTDEQSRYNTSKIIETLDKLIENSKYSKFDKLSNTDLVYAISSRLKKLSNILNITQPLRWSRLSTLLDESILMGNQIYSILSLTFGAFYRAAPGQYVEYDLDILEKATMPYYNKSSYNKLAGILLRDTASGVIGLKEILTGSSFNPIDDNLNDMYNRCNALSAYTLRDINILLKELLTKGGDSRLLLLILYDIFTLENIEEFSNSIVVY